MKSPTDSLSLQPNDFIDFTVGQRLANTPKMRKETDFSWKDGTLILTQLTVAEIHERLEEIYGYSFDVAEPKILKERKTLAVPMDK